MAFKQAIDIYELLDDPGVNGEKTAEFFKAAGIKNVEVKRVHGEKGYTDFVKVIIPGKNGKINGGKAPTLGVIGRLGGIGARPEVIGFVSDGDGAASALTTALKIGTMNIRGDVLPGDVIVTTHVCPNAPTLPHDPVPFMDSPVDIATMNEYEVDKTCDAILSIDTTKGNRLVNYKGITITPTVKSGYILKVSYDLIDILEKTSGKSAVVFPLAVQDITPYGNDITHVNSILQPAVATDAPVVGVAITTQTLVAGCASGASHVEDISGAADFAVEVAKYYGCGKCEFYSEEEFKKLEKLYGNMKHLQTAGKAE